MKYTSKLHPELKGVVLIKEGSHHLEIIPATGEYLLTDGKKVAKIQILKDGTYLKEVGYGKIPKKIHNYLIAESFKQSQKESNNDTSTK